MARLIAPNGSTVSVSDARAEVLLAQGYTAAADGEKKATKTTTKKSSPRKSSK